MGKLQFIPALSRGWRIFLKDPLNLILGGVVSFLLGLTIVLAPVMIAGYFHLTRIIARGEKAELGQVFHGFNDFGRYFLGGLIFLLAMLPAYLLGLALQGLGVIAGAVILGLLLPYWPLMVDRGLDGTEAFKASLDSYKREYLTTTIIALLFIAFCMIAMLTFGLTHLVTLPLTATIMMAAYEQTFGYREEEEPVREAEFEDLPGNEDDPEA